MNQSKQSKLAGLSFIRFNKAKSMVARPATDVEIGLFERGRELGTESAEHKLAWQAALKLVGRDHAKRMALRGGFVAAYAPLRGVSEAAAILQFNRMAAVFAPESSRKAKSNAAKAKAKAKPGRKEKTANVKGTLSEKEVAKRLTQALAYIAKAQQQHAGDDEMLEVLGEIASILGGKAK